MSTYEVPRNLLQAELARQRTFKPTVVRNILPAFYQLILDCLLSTQKVPSGARIFRVDTIPNENTQPYLSFTIAIDHPRDAADITAFAEVAQRTLGDLQSYIRFALRCLAKNVPAPVRDAEIIALRNEAPQMEPVITWIAGTTIFYNQPEAFDDPAGIRFLSDVNRGNPDGSVLILTVEH